MDRCAYERSLTLARKQDTYLREFTKLMHRAAVMPLNSDGTVCYTKRYEQSASGYRGRVYAKGVAQSKVPRRIRQIAYDGMDARGWGVEMAYFTFATQISDKLRIKIDIPYFNMETLRLYIRDKDAVWNSIEEYGNLSNGECEKLRNAVFNGGTIDGIYMSSAYLRNISREGRSTRWMASYPIPDVYGKLTAGEKKGWAEASAQSYLLAGVAARVLEALADHCMYLCRSGKGCALEHMGLQFGGDDVIMKPFPANFKESAKEEIATRTGYKVNLVENISIFL